MDSLATRLLPRLALTLCIVLLTAFAVSGIADRYGESGYETAWRKALVAFGVAKGLNAVISMVQGSELDLKLFGSGVTVALGELLDPVNDVVEMLSDVLLASLVALFVQQILLWMGQWWPLQVLLPLVALAALALLWGPALWRGVRPSGTSGPRLHGARAHGLGARARFTLALWCCLVLLRLGIPGAVYLSDRAAVVFLEPHYQASLEAAQAIRAETDVDSQLLGTTAEGGGVGAREAVGILERMRNLVQSLERLTEHAVRLMAVFVLQTMVFPLGLLALLVLLGRAALRQIWGGPSLASFAAPAGSARVNPPQADPGQPASGDESD